MLRTEFKKAAELDPTHASGYYYNLGAIMVNKGQMDEAADALKKATDLDPTNANAWYWYGMALMGKAQIKPDGTMVPAPGTVEAFQTYLKLAAQRDLGLPRRKPALTHSKARKAWSTRRRRNRFVLKTAGPAASSAIPLRGFFADKES